MKFIHQSVGGSVHIGDIAERMDGVLHGREADVVTTGKSRDTVVRDYHRSTKKEKKN